MWTLVWVCIAGAYCPEHEGQVWSVGTIDASSYEDCVSKGQAFVAARLPQETIKFYCKGPNSGP